MTTIGEPPLEFVQSALPLLDRWFGTKAMFKEKKSATRLENAMDLSDSLDDIVDAAQRKGAHHAVKRAILKREFLTLQDMRVDIHIRLGNSSLGSLVSSDIGIHYGDLPNARRIMWQVEPGSKANLQDFRYGVNQQFLAVLGY